MSAWSKFYRLHDALEEIENLLFNIASRRDELDSFGLKYVVKRLDFDRAKDSLNSFLAQLESCLQAARFIDGKNSERFVQIISETRIEDLITQMSVKLKIAEREESSPFAGTFLVYAYVLRRLFPQTKRAMLFSDESVGIEHVLASISRLKAVVKTLEEDAYRRENNDDEIFKPSNVNIEKLINHVDLSVTLVANNEEIDPERRDRLIAYLSDAKAELAKDEPSWRKIVGVLMICSTLLSGIDAAPDAVENLSAAVRHILGSGIERSMPDMLPRVVKPVETDEGSLGEVSSDTEVDLDVGVSRGPIVREEN